MNTLFTEPLSLGSSRRPYGRKYKVTRATRPTRGLFSL